MLCKNIDEYSPSNKDAISLKSFTKEAKWTLGLQKWFHLYPRGFFISEEGCNYFHFTSYFTKTKHYYEL